MSKLSARGTTKKNKNGAAKARGFPGILNSLAAEHAEISALMKECSEGSQDDRRALFPEIHNRLLVHGRCEEAEFYPVCRQVTELSRLVSQSRDDHQDVEGYLADLDNLELDDPDWEEIFEELRASVDEHVALEEERLFPRVADALDEQRLVEMDEAFKQRRRSMEEVVEDMAPISREIQPPVF